MADHVKCELVARGCGKERFEQICKFVESEESLFDPDKIMPMPKELDLEEGSANKVFKDIFLKYSSEKKHPFGKPFSMGGDEVIYIRHNITRNEMNSVRKHLGDYNGNKIPAEEAVREAIHRGWRYLHNRMYYSAETWYYWSIEHWGTKWIADVVTMKDLEKNEFGWCFTTAWSAPRELINVLSVIFPEVIFELRYADEDLGYNCGVLKFINGTSMRMVTPSGDRDEDSVAFAKQLWGDED